MGARGDGRGGGGGRRPSAADAAIAYRAGGWRPVPIGPGSKAPHDPESGRPLRGWATYEPDGRAIEAWRGGGFGVGVVLGEASGGLTDVDLDAPEAIVLADMFLPPTGAAFGRASKPRSHRIFVAEGARTRRFADGERSSLVEVRGTGAQTVFPPSRHPSGERIVWQGSSTRAMVVGAPELVRCVAALAIGALVLRRAPRVGPERRRNLAFAMVDGIAGAWARAREILPVPDLQAIERFAGVRVAERRPLVGGAPAPRRRPISPDEATRRAARARAYLATCDAAVSGRGGHGTAFVAALKIIRGFSRDEADARSWEPEWRRLLAEYNRRCLPPWSRRELEYKIRDALRGAALRWGFLLDASPRARASLYDGSRR
ncbi:MAG: bifunctional DNA primase/polymerase [Polyangiaceae bacterium]|nr:bifunctional DNA primase/polymerase [Polyangiaceae bacterium]